MLNMFVIIFIFILFCKWYHKIWFNFSSDNEHDKICAYDSHDNSQCTYDQSGIIDDVFKAPFKYDEVEIPFSTKELELTFPHVTKSVIINIKPDSAVNLKINSVDSLQITQNSTQCFANSI